MTIERQLPQDLEAEQQAIGCCLHNPLLIPVVLSVARPEHFFDELHRRLLLTLDGMSNRGESINTVTATIQIIHEWPECQTLFPNIRAAISDLYNSGFIGGEGVARSTAKYVRQAADLRQAIDTLTRASEAAYDLSANPQDIVDETIGKLVAMTVDRKHSISGDARTVLNGTDTEPALWGELLEELAAPRDIRGIRTGWEMFDSWLSGLQATQLYTIIADTSVGKSLWVHWLSWMLAKQGYRSMIVSTEMNRREILRRLAYMDAQIDIMAVSKRPNGATDSEFRRLNEAMEWLQSENPVVITDLGQPMLDVIVGEVKRQKAMRHIDVVFVDHIQHIQVRGIPWVNESSRISATTAALKGVAMNEYLPVVQVSHINRESAKAGYAGVHGGRGSGSIEQDSNVQLELTAVKWGIGADNKLGWVPFESELELLQFQATNNRQPVRIQVNKNRSGGKPWDVMIRDWSQGGRLLSPEQEDMR